MSVRVLIEREMIPGNELQISQLLTRLRAKAMHARGYISGETLQSLDDPNKSLVISTWNTLEDWKAWEKDPDRERIENEVDRLLRHPTKPTVYVHS